MLTVTHTDSKIFIWKISFYACICISKKTKRHRRGKILTGYELAHKNCNAHQSLVICLCMRSLAAGLCAAKLAHPDAIDWMGWVVCVWGPAAGGCLSPRAPVGTACKSS